jgi:hypothetical protein
MDGKGRWIDNVFVERLWRSVKYESMYLHAHETPREVKVELARYFDFLQCTPAASEPRISNTGRDVLPERKS